MISITSQHVLYSVSEGLVSDSGAAKGIEVDSMLALVDETFGYEIGDGQCSESSSERVTGEVYLWVFREERIA